MVHDPARKCLVVIQAVREIQRRVEDLHRFGPAGGSWTRSTTPVCPSHEVLAAVPKSHEKPVLKRCCPVTYDIHVVTTLRGPFR
jgi:hypothetical protein